MAFDNFEDWDAVKQAKYNKTIEEIQTNISSCDGDVNKIIDFSLDAICSASHAVAGTFWYYDVNADGFIRAFSVRGGADLSAIRLKIGEGIAGKVIKTGVPEKIYDVQKDENWSSKTDENTGFVTKSMMCIPLTANNYTFGCVQLINKDDGSFFDEKDFEFVMKLSDDIANFIDEYNVFPEIKDFENTACLYLKLDNYDEIASVLKPRDLISLLNDFLKIVNTTIIENEGTIDLFNYGEVLAYWINKRDDNKTVNTACKTAKALIDLNGEIRSLVGKKYGFDIYYSVGLCYGHSIKNVVGFDKNSHRTIVGEAPCKAKELQGQANIGTILVNKQIVDNASGFVFSKVDAKGGLFKKKQSDEDANYILS